MADLARQMALLDAVATGAPAPVRALLRVSPEEAREAQALQALYRATHGTALTWRRAVGAVRSQAPGATDPAPDLPTTLAEAEARCQQARRNVLGRLKRGAMTLLLYVGATVGASYLLAAFHALPVPALVSTVLFLIVLVPLQLWMMRQCFSGLLDLLVDSIEWMSREDQRQRLKAAEPSVTSPSLPSPPVSDD